MSAFIANGTVRVVTGPRAAGKTAFCRLLVRRARSEDAGFTTAGVLSPKVFLQGREAAIDAVDLSTGQHRRLAVRGDVDSTGDGPSTLRWRFDAEVLAWGNTVLQSATPCDLLVVDELGPLEFIRGEGWISGLAAVDTMAFGSAAVVVRPELIEHALQRWPGALVTRIDNPSEAAEVAGQYPLRFFH